LIPISLPIVPGFFFVFENNLCPTQTVMSFFCKSPQILFVSHRFV